MSIDTHIHLFTRGLPRASDIRHDPGYDATLDQLQALAEVCGVKRFVIVQPSFLGSDNSYLLEQIARHPDLMVGVAVLDPATREQEIESLRAKGIRGIRLNLLGRDLNQALNASTLGLVARCTEQGLHIEVHDNGSRLPYVLEKVGPLARTLVVDHFGRPDAQSGGIASPEFETLLEAGAQREWYVKISAPYRCPGVDVGQACRRFIEHWGADKLLWGSDWPWTQHERQLEYADWCGTFAEQGELWAQMEANARRVFGFEPRGDARI